MVWMHEPFVGAVASLWWWLGAEAAAQDQGWIERQRKAAAEEDLSSTLGWYIADA
jgi:hypothetical protein